MNVGIVIYSHTGNTLKAAEKVRETLVSRGHTAQILRVHAQNEEPNARESRNAPVKLTFAPDTTPFDAVLFGSPVYAFSLCPIMKAYMEGMPSLSGKKAGVFVTHHFPKAWLGGNRSARQMAQLCRLKGADPAASAVVNWSGKELDRQIADAADKLSAAVG